MTTNPTSVVDHDALTVRRTIHIAASVDKVWRAVTEPERISQWFGQTVLPGGAAGAQGTITWPDGVTVPIRVEKIDPPRMVSYRWGNDETDAAVTDDLDVRPSTVFTFTLEPVDEGTQLTVVESGFEALTDPAGALESHREGWDDELDKLVALLEAPR
ncbi:SRPBCC family protein [Jiangella endophytica]|uniref:SRPBCC family protein n=1 Tax=Jiangella endophytica TaxID=1623398 RepID=UPI000E34C569|nr:SRPBCC family protein [Jiangella endophytica]